MQTPEPFQPLTLDTSEFTGRLDRPVSVKIQEFQRNDRLKHLIFAAQLSPSLLEKLRLMADRIRHVSRTRAGNLQLRSLLAHRRAMLYFTQPSTRTFLSFMAACQILGLTCNEVRDPKTSSETKRESAWDSIRMFSSYFDVIIMRTPHVNFSECCAYLMDDLERSEMRAVPIINAGSGADEHPTQALLDFYTIQRTFTADYSRESKQSRFIALQKQFPQLVAGPSHKTYLFCGDIARGRTVRSLAIVLSQYPGLRMFFVSPDHPTLRIDAPLKRLLASRNVEVHEFDTLDATFNGESILSQADCVYMTRIQREHNSADDEQAFGKIDLSQFRLTRDRARRLKEYAPIMHPFPRDSITQEIPTEIDTDPRAMYFRQARNGMWIRAALLVHVFDASDDLLMIAP